MKKTILMFLFCLMVSVAQAQCVAEVKDVIQDKHKGSIIVETEYALNGEVVQSGRSRYTERNPFTEKKWNNSDLEDLIKFDIRLHCKNLIARIDENKKFIKDQKLKQQKSLTEPIIKTLKTDLIGHKERETEAVSKFKGKTIKVTYDKKNTITDSVLTP